MTNWDQFGEPLNDEEQAVSQAAPSWISVANPVPTGPVGPQGPWAGPQPYQSSPSTGDPALDARLGTVTANFGDRNVPDYTARESLGYLGQAGGNLAELATSSYAGPLGLPDNPLTQELTRPVNYMFGGSNIIPAITGNLGARAADTVAEPYIDQLPEGLQGPARFGTTIAGALAGGAAGAGAQSIAKRGLRGLDAFLGDAPAGYIDPSRRGTLRSEIVPGAAPGDDALRAAQEATDGPLPSFPGAGATDETKALYGQLMERVKAQGWTPENTLAYRELTGRNMEALTNITGGVARPLTDAERAAIPPSTFTNEAGNLQRTLNPAQEAARAEGATARSLGGVPGQVNPDMPFLGTPAETVQRLKYTIENAQAMNAAELRAFRSQQAGGFAGASQAGGREGLYSGLAAMKGQATRIGIKPLAEAIGPAEQDMLINEVLSSNLRPFEKATAGQALDNLIQNGRIPTFGEMKLIDSVFGPEVISNPLKSLGIKPVMTFGERLQDVLAAPLTAKSTYDLSAPGRQLAPMLYAHPTEIPRVFRAQIRALRNADAFAASQNALIDAPHAELRDIAGVDLGGLGAFRREEQIASSLAEKVLPGSKRFNDAYTAAINEGRDWLFQQLLSKVDPALTQMRDGVLLNPDGYAELQKIGRLVNASTGRGTLPAFMTENQVLGQPLLWAPKLLAGRVQLPAAMFSSSPTVRNEAARQVVSFVGANTAILGLIKASGAADVELDPRSSDFGQIRIGNRRFDPWAGYRPIANFIARESVAAANALGDAAPGLGLASDTPTNKAVNTDEIPGSFYSKSALKIAGDFIRSKLAPVPGEVANQIIGKDVTGSDVTKAIGDVGGKAVGRVENALIGTLAPIFLESIAQEMGYTVPRGYKEGGLPGAALEAGKSLLSNSAYFSGMGGGYYTPDVKQRVAGGEYSQLKPAEQFEGIKPEAWRIIQEKAPDNLKEQVGVGSFYDWFQSQQQQMESLVAQRAPQLTPAERSRYATELVRKNPVYKAYLNARTHLTDQWVQANPDLARQMDDDMQDVPASERQFVPTKSQRAVIGR